LFNDKTRRITQFDVSLSKERQWELVIELLSQYLAPVLALGGKLLLGMRKDKPHLK